jgi:hypothetical protein
LEKIREEASPMCFEKDAKNNIFTPFLKNVQAPPWLALCSLALPLPLLLSAHWLSLFLSCSLLIGSPCSSPAL